MSELAIRSLAWTSPTAWIAIAACVVFLGLGLRAVLDPVGASAFFGAAVAPDHANGLTFVRAFGARNIGLALTGLALLYIDAKAGFAALLLSASLIAGLDFYAVSLHAGMSGALKHLGYVVALGAFAVWIATRP